MNTPMFLLLGAGVDPFDGKVAANYTNSQNCFKVDVFLSDISEIQRFSGFSDYSVFSLGEVVGDKFEGL